LGELLLLVQIKTLHSLKNRRSYRLQLCLHIVIWKWCEQREHITAAFK